MVDVRKSGQWVDENGDRVGISPFFSHIYRDKLSEDLDNRYLVSESLPFRLKLGKTEHEGAAESLLRIYRGIGAIVGVEKRELDRLGDDDMLTSSCLFWHSWDYGALSDKGLLRVKKVGGIEVIFPTEDLIKEGFKKSGRTRT